MAYLLALDQGTTSSRALIFDEYGTIHGLAQREFEQFFPHPGWVEHDPHAIIDSQFGVARQALLNAGLHSRDIAALGITNQRETLVVWDRRSGRACAPALVWQDRRTAEHCARLRAEGHESMVRAKTGLPIDPYFTASKLHWLLSNDSGLKRRAEAGELACGTIDSWLVWQLTDGRCHITDASNASRTLLFDIHQQCWDPGLLELWQVPPAMLPEVVDCSGVVAETTAFGEPIAIAGMAGDQQAALFGQACFSPGMSKCTYGTGCFVLMHTGMTASEPRSGVLTTVACRLNGVTEYALEGSVFMGGATVQWLRDGLGIIEKASEIEALAASVDDNGGVTLVPAFTGLGAPYWDADARALLIGMTRGTTRAHIARAALEGIAWQVTDVVDAMRADAGVRLADLRVDGGASHNTLLMQLQADYLDLPLVQPAIVESTAYGAALLAGLGVGVFKDREAIAGQWQAAQRFQPGMAEAERTRRATVWHEAVMRSRGWASVA